MGLGPDEYQKHRLDGYGQGERYARKAMASWLTQPPPPAKLVELEDGEARRAQLTGFAQGILRTFDAFENPANPWLAPGVANLLDEYQPLQSDDDVKRDLELTHMPCGTHLCDVEPGDEMSVLVGMCAGHARTCTRR
jgi:hypothetical protein